MSEPRRPLPPGAVLGVLGGGQLGRMFVHAAQTLGYGCVVLDPDDDSPAGWVAHTHIPRGYLDDAGLAELAERADAVTTEFENVPAEALRRLAGQRPVAPAAEAVAICQDRAAEKAHFQQAGVPCAPHAVLNDAASLAAVPDALLPGILKTARLGYDGKGQARVTSRAELERAWDRMGRVPCVLEQLMPLEAEFSVIVARGHDGQMVHYAPQRNLHRDGILAVTWAPAPGIAEPLQAEAVRCARALAEEMAYVGVLCVEFFVANGRLLANEMAPRPHNSGHYTIDACDASQFDLQARALAALPLTAPRLHSAAVMLNLLGELWVDGEPDWPAVLALPGVHLHLYGKSEPRAGRKMGHLTVTAATPQAAEATARAVARHLGLAPW